MDTNDESETLDEIWDDSDDDGDALYPPNYAGPPLTNDMKFREMLAKSIGLDKVPDIDPKAFDRMLASFPKCDEELVGTFDVVEAVREVRDW